MSDGIGKWKLVLLATFVLLCDQLSKFTVLHFLSRGDCYQVLSFFNIVRVENRGITFGIFNGASTSALVLILLSLAIVLLLVMWVRREMIYQLPASGIIAGAVGNALDRIFHGAVIDFLDFHIGAYHWPAFNVADSVIVVAATAMVCFSRCLEKRKGSQELRS
ncbi:MAG: signal peptidase II [Holosporaceae bacterium]|nr:signal peptidase II [Holosporaceae bacterium]